MTRILGRLILGSLAVTFLLTAGALTMILCAGLTLRLVIDEGLQVVQLPPMIQHIAIRSLTFTLPISVLTSVILTYGRMSADREFQAAQWCGVRPLWLYLPGIFLGICSGLASWIANDFWIPASQYSLARSIERSVAELSLIKLTQGERGATFRGAPVSPEQVNEWERPLFRLYVKNPGEKGALHDVYLFELDSARGYTAGSIHYAAQGRIDFLRRPHRVQLTLDRLSSLRLDENRDIASRLAEPPAGQSFVYTFPIPKPFMRLDPPQMDSGRILYELETGANDPKREKILRRTFVERDAMSAANLVFALLGIPLGLLGRRGNFFAGLALSLVPIFGLYYPAMMAGRSLCGSAWTSCILALWSPTLLLAAVGGFLARWVSRRSA